MDVIGNVKDEFVKPPNYSGPVMVGHLMFDADFESGNLGRIEYSADNEYDLFIRVDTCNQKYRLWFYFSVSNCCQNQTVIFHICNFSKGKSLYREGMSPCVRSTSRPKWTRLPSQQCYYWRNDGGCYILSFTFKFDLEERYEFAYCYPYSYTDLQNYLSNLAPELVERSIIGQTLQKRNMDLLSIGEGNRTIVVMSRVHPGETPASFIMEGFLDFITNIECELASFLRSKVKFKVIPMLNPDGVALGNYRCSLMGFDLNRHWRDTNPWAQPGLHAVKTYLVQLEKDEEVDFCFDIHAHSMATGAFMYGNVFENDDKQMDQQTLPRLFGALSEDFSVSRTNFNKDSVKAGTARRVLGGLFPKSYTLEVSFFHYQKELRSIPYDTKSFKRLGENLGRTLVEYYRLYPPCK